MLNVSNEFSKNSEIRDTCTEHSKNKEIHENVLETSYNACKWKCILRLEQVGSA